MKYISKETRNRLRDDERKNISIYMYWFSEDDFEPDTIRTLVFSDNSVKTYSFSFPMYIMFDSTNNFLKMNKRYFF